MTASAPVANVPQGCSTKLTVLASSLRNAPPATSSHDVSTDMVWRSSDTTKFTVNRHGLAISQNSSGSATITATGWQGEFSITLTAAPAVLVSIFVGPFDTNVNVAGTVNPYTAVGLWSDGASTNPLSANFRAFPSAVTWGVNPMVDGSLGQATIASTAIDKATATGVAAGIVEITAANSGVIGATYLNVGLTGITISPAPTASVPKGETLQFNATLIFGGPSITDSNTRNYVRWNSSASQVARIGSTFLFCTGSCPTGGLVHTFTQGTTNIVAVSGSISSLATSLTVAPPVVTTLNISYQGCNPADVPLGVSCQFEAIATYSDETMANVTNSTTWNSTDTTCVAVSTTALATTLNPPPSPTNPCSAKISGTFSGVPSTPSFVTMNVTAHVLRSISVVPPNPTVPKPNQQPFGIVQHWTDGNVFKPGSNCPSWMSSASSVATIVQNSGLATAVNPGTANISVSNCFGMQASTVMTVVPAQLQTITVAAIAPEPLSPPDPAHTTIPVTAKQDFMATGNYSDGSHVDITGTVNWTSSNTAVATMSDPTDPNEATGMAAGGPVTITATDPTTLIAGTASLVVKTISFITVTPSGLQTVSPGGTVQFAATANYPGPVTQPLANFGPAWSSMQPAIATVDPTGLATGVSASPPNATIVAQMGSVDCTMAGGACGTVGVSAAVLQSITVSCDPNDPCQMSGGSALLSLGRNEQMIATGHYSDNSTQDLTSLATWAPASGNLPVNVDNAGYLTTKNLGSVSVTATCANSVQCPGAPAGGIQGNLPVTVTF